MEITTLQTNLKTHDMSSAMRNYSLFLGSVDTTHEALKQYDPLRSGRGRIFFLRMPEFMKKIMPDQTRNIRHLMEYGFTKIDGIGDVSLETETMTGGYVGKQIAMPTLAKDETNQITIGLYEFTGSPVREYIDMWISGIADKETGFSTYHGLCSERLARELYSQTEPLAYSQANHTAEAIYLTTDPTGLSTGIEYCCLLTNMFPTNSIRSHFNYNSGESNIVTIDVQFSCNKYESSQINEIGAALLQKYQVLKSTIDLKSGYTPADVEAKGKDRIHAWDGVLYDDARDDYQMVNGGVTSDVF